jgi:hypothetical protein
MGLFEEGSAFIDKDRCIMSLFVEFVLGAELRTTPIVVGGELGGGDVLVMNESSFTVTHVSLPGELRALWGILWNVNDRAEGDVEVVGKQTEDDCVFGRGARGITFHACPDLRPLGTYVRGGFLGRILSVLSTSNDSADDFSGLWEAILSQTMPQKSPKNVVCTTVCGFVRALLSGATKVVGPASPGVLGAIQAMGMVSSSWRVDMTNFSVRGRAELGPIYRVVGPGHDEESVAQDEDALPPDNGQYRAFACGPGARFCHDLGMRALALGQAGLSGYDIINSVSCPWVKDGSPVFEVKMSERDGIHFAEIMNEGEIRSALGFSAVAAVVSAIVNPTRVTHTSMYDEPVAVATSDLALLYAKACEVADMAAKAKEVIKNHKWE